MRNGRNQAELMRKFLLSQWLCHHLLFGLNYFLPLLAGCLGQIGLLSKVFGLNIEAAPGPQITNGGIWLLLLLIRDNISLGDPGKHGLVIVVAMARIYLVHVLQVLFLILQLRVLSHIMILILHVIGLEAPVAVLRVLIVHLVGHVLH